MSLLPVIASSRRRGGGAGGDPYFTDVIHGVHGNGSNGGTTITDIKGLSCTAAGNLVTSTAQSKFNGSSLAFDGNGDYYTAVGGGVFNFTGDFCVDFWCRPTSLGNWGLFHFAASLPSSSLAGFAMGYSTSAGGFRFFANGGNVYEIGGAGTFGTGTWHYIGVQRSSGVISIWVDGTQLGTTLSYGSTISFANLYFGMYYQANLSINGYAAEIRVTTHTRDLSSVPTAPFPDS